MKQFLKDKQGILLFRNGGAGHHTELWDKTHIIQDGKAISGGGAIMNESNIFGQPRVLFWEVIEEKTGLNPVPVWLQGCWKVFDGNMYYYFFSDQHVVTYTKVVVDWNPADGGETQETFTRPPISTDSMSGVSNRYAPLSATKMN